MENQTLSDSLTGLFNRYSFLLLAEEQLKLLHRSPQGLLLFLCNLDGMKSINANFGQGEGDQALINTAALLRATFRNSDVIARLEADEFVILAVGTLPATAELLQARLQANLNKHNARANRPYKLSFSIGVAYVAPEGKATVAELLSTAEKETHRAKQSRGTTRSA